jgi:hypothetical protein
MRSVRTTNNSIKNKILTIPSEFGDYKIPHYAHQYLTNMAFAASMINYNKGNSLDLIANLHRISHIDSFLSNRWDFYTTFKECDTRTLFIIKIHGMLQAPIRYGYNSPEIPGVSRQTIDFCEEYISNMGLDCDDALMHLRKEVII